jgi:pilus assembly protein TadC
MVARMIIVGVMIQKWKGNIPLILSKMVLFSVTGIYPPEIRIKMSEFIGSSLKEGVGFAGKSGKSDR